MSPYLYSKHLHDITLSVLIVRLKMCGRREDDIVFRYENGSRRMMKKKCKKDQRGGGERK